MAMLSSYTTLMSPAPAPAKPSSAAALLLRGRQPAAALAVPLRWASCESRSRAAVFSRPCLGKNDKYTYDIEHSALVQTPTLAGNDWSIMGMGDKDLYVLKLRVGESTSKDKLFIRTEADDQEVRLVIRYKKKEGEADDGSKATNLDVNLKLPPGYDAKKQPQAWKFDEWLIVVVSKPKPNPDPVTVQ